MHTQDLEKVIADFSGGSDGRTRHWANKRFICTEGAGAVAQAAGAFWLLDTIALEMAPKFREAWINNKASVGVVRFVVTDQAKGKLTLSLQDDEPDAYSDDITFTDFPVGDWSFYLAQDAMIEDPDNDGVGVTVLMLTSEY